MGAGHTYIEMYVRCFCCHLLVSELFSLLLWFEDQSTFSCPGGLHEEAAYYKEYCNMQDLVSPFGSTVGAVRCHSYQGSCHVYKERDS